MSAEILIQKAKVQLVLHQPFFASIIFKRKIAISDTLPTACVDMSGKITMGRKFVEDLNVHQVVFLLAHESMHYAMLHGLRRGWRNPRAFNIACDKVINDILKESNVGEVIPNGVYQDGARAFMAEQLYREEDSGSEYSPGTGNDDLSDENTPEDLEQLADEISQEIAQAVQAATASQGTLPQGLKRLVNEIINPPTPWHTLLERWMTGFINADYTWSRPRKTMMSVGYFPGHSKRPTIGTIAVIADTSGSIGSEEMDHFIGHLNSIMEKCAPEKVYFLHVDAKVQQVDEFTPEELPLKIGKLKGGGGTDMGVGLAHIEEEGYNPDVCVVLTDGFTPWPAVQPLFPMAVLCTTDQSIPYGELISYRIEKGA